ncbi:MAG: cysteine peptidase family C39 domain-containing protein [Anaerolineae bacterium]
MTPTLPVYQQETPYSCVAACLRMVLAYFGVEVDEDALR